MKTRVWLVSYELEDDGDVYGEGRYLTKADITNNMYCELSTGLKISKLAVKRKVIRRQSPQ